MQPARQTRFTEAEYLALEGASETKHEFVDGEIRAMAGGTPRHNLVCANLVRALSATRDGRPCLTLTSDQRIHVAARRRYTYPDAVVVCGPVETATADPLSIVNPSLVAEVLSPSTERHDLGDKFDAYRELPSLHAFVVVRAERRAATVWERTDVGRWTSTAVEGGGAVVIERLGVRFPIDALYENVNLLGPDA